MQERLLAVQRMQDYILAHLNETVTLADLAQVSLFSPWYAYRLFRELTGLSPASYIRRLKLSRSAQRLREEGSRVVDIAFELGFGSVDGYQRAFLREFGCNPKDYARHPGPLPLFIPYGVKYREIMEESLMCEQKCNPQTVFLQLIEKPARQVWIKRGQTAEDYWTYCQEVGCEIWGLLTSIPQAIGEPVCLWLPERYRLPGSSCYVQGVEVEPTETDAPPAGLDAITLPASSYLMFQGEPFAEEDYCLAIDALQAAERRYDPSVIGYAWDKENPRIQLEPQGTRGYIELLPVKPLSGR